MECQGLPCGGWMPGFLSRAMVQLLRESGNGGGKPAQVVKELEEEAEKASYWLWLPEEGESSWGLAPQ